MTRIIARKKIVQVMSKTFGKVFQYEILLNNNQEVIGNSHVQNPLHQHPGIKAWLHQYRKSKSTQLEFIASRDKLTLNFRIHDRSNKLEGLKFIFNASKLAVYEMGLSKDFPLHCLHWVISGYYRQFCCQWNKENLTTQREEKRDFTEQYRCILICVLGLGAVSLILKFTF